ncbi:MAG TPA: LysR family transcriptional regulator [Thermoleophilaceae bacterium]|jgi:DNA-binding transcriptional LysR family regulator|nr:LysR family transcriptional regulator [Thermoleophilaceae bacterium]
MLDSRRLLLFRAAAHAGSFTRAGAELSLTQSAVSQQVASLERQLGLELLRRGRRGLALTGPGELLLGHADAIAERLALADAQLTDLARVRRDRLRVGAFPSALATLIPAMIAATREQVPDAQVEAIEAPSAELHRLVRRGALHMAVGFGDVGEPNPDTEAGVRRYDLFVEPMLAALPFDHPLADRPHLSLAALSDDEWLAPSPDHLIVRACRAAGFEPRIAFVTSDPAAIRALIARGLAVTIVPSLLSDQLAGTALVPIAPGAPRRQIYAIAPDPGASPLALTAIEALKASGRPS